LNILKGVNGLKINEEMLNTDTIKKMESCCLGFNVFSNNSVQSSSSFVSDDSRVNLQSISLLVFLDDSLLLELLQSPSDNLGTGLLMSFRSALSSVKASLDVRQKSDSSSWSDVDFSGQRSNFVVDPVIIGGGELVSWNK
jgi:hypothetical protein